MSGENNNFSLRPDLQVVADWIPASSRVLDVGCGDGDLLHWLTAHKQVDGRGLEVDTGEVASCIARGLSVVQGDANADLSYYSSGAFDYTVMGQTLQRMANPAETLKQLVRIGKQSIVSVPNFAHWRNRIYLLCHGRMPVTKTLRYEWYETPNIHFCSITDFLQLCESLNIEVERRIYVTHQGISNPFSGQGWLANTFGEQGIFLLKGR